MIFRNKYTISKWTDWGHDLSKSIDDFHDQYSYYPNILEANSYTYSQLDFLTNLDFEERRKVIRKNELSNLAELPSDDDIIELSTFKSNNCSLDFAINENLSDKEFLLIFDSEPDWDGESTKITSPVEVSQSVLIGR